MGLGFPKHDVTCKLLTEGFNQYFQSSPKAGYNIVILKISVHFELATPAVTLVTVR